MLRNIDKVQLSVDTAVMPIKFCLKTKAGRKALWDIRLRKVN